LCDEQLQQGHDRRRQHFEEERSHGAER
jgi:hypothetical protein